MSVEVKSNNKIKEKSDERDLQEEGSSEERTPFRRRHDLITWLCSMFFLFLYLAAIYLTGYYRHYNVNSGYSCNQTEQCLDRFLPEPFVEEPGVRGRYGTSATGRWYLWQLKPNLVYWYTRFIPWVLYLLHQLFVWLCTFFIQKNKRKDKSDDRYSHQMSKWNWIYLGGNTAFFLIHYIQTNVTYDGLAPDVSISSSQGSVIMLLIFIMVIEYRDRGIVFGWPSQYHKGVWSQRLRLTYDVMYLVRRYHGYAFSWACVYTFWYHPLEGTWGHVTGTFHVFIVLLQGNLAFTKFHLNKYWRFLLETWVTVHGAVVGAQTGGPSMKGTAAWPMFFFGFLFLIFFTQLYGLPFWKKLPSWSRCLPVLVIYIPVVLGAYSAIPDSEGRTWVRIQEVIRIPGIYYLFFFFIWLWTWILLKIQTRCSPVPKDPEMWRRVLSAVGAMFIYAIFIVSSILVQLLDWRLDLIILMVVFLFLFMMGVSVTFVLLDWVFAVKTNLPDSCVDVNVEAGQEKATDHKM